MSVKHINLKLASVLLAASAMSVVTLPSFSADEAVAPVAAPAAPAIRVVAANKRELVETLSVNGSIVAREEAVIGSDLNGLTVLALNADIGDTVKKGDVLAVLDRSMLDTQLAQAEATRAQAVASIAQMQAQIADSDVGVRQANEALERARALQTKGVATQAQFDTAKNSFDSAKAKLEISNRALAASEAQLGVLDAQENNVKVQIGKTELRAPADGLVLSRDATLGGVVSSAGAPLFRIAIGSEFELAADVAETSLPRLAVGMPAKVLLGGATDAIDGKVRRISPEVVQASRLGAIRITLAPGSVAHAGGFARGEVEILRRNGIAVPSSALVYKGDKAFLQTVVDGAIKTVGVTVGARSGAMVEIVEGLSEGQEVVSRAGTFVADGDRVTPVRGETTGAIKP